MIQLDWLFRPHGGKTYGRPSGDHVYLAKGECRLASITFLRPSSSSLPQPHLTKVIFSFFSLAEPPIPSAMGQRHQLFVIAKIAGRYRTLCVIHHQWLYGATALKCCLQLGKIFQAEENRIPLQQELIAARSKDESFWCQKVDYRSSSRYSFPYILTCLIHGASFSAKRGYYHQVQVEPFNLEFDGGDNNNGITILDITELNSVRYCFVDFQGMESAREVQLMSPLSAADYLWAYYDKDDSKSQEQFGTLVEELMAWPLVDVDSLSSTWPSGDWKHNTEDVESSDVVHDTLTAPSGQPTSLRTSAMDTLVREMLKQSEPDLALLSEAELLSDFTAKLRLKLDEYADELKSSSASLQIVRKVLKQSPGFNLGLLHKFGIEDLCKLISELQSEQKVTLLNISSSPVINEGGLRKILQITPDLKKLYLMETPNLPIHSVLAQLQSCSVTLEDLYHSDLFLRPLKSLESRKYDDGLKFPVGTKTRSPVVELLWVAAGVKGLRQKAQQSDGRIDWGLVSNIIDKEEFRGWNYGAFPLDDVFLSPRKLVTGLLSFANYILHEDGYSTNISDFAKAAAFSFSMAPARVPGSGHMISPIPSRLWWSSHVIARREGWSLSSMRHLRPGDWAIVILHRKISLGEKDEGDPRFEYAFITPRNAGSSGSGPGFLIMDIRSFLVEITDATETKQLTKHWERTLGDNSVIHPCDEHDVQGMIRSLFTKKPDPPKKAGSDGGQPTENSRLEAGIVSLKGDNTGEDPAP